jgi:hypothetical protein
MYSGARVIIANQPPLIIQRGNNRQVVFAQEQDYTYYVEAKNFSSHGVRQ